MRRILVAIMKIQKCSKTEAQEILHIIEKHQIIDIHRCSYVQIEQAVEDVNNGDY